MFDHFVCTKLLVIPIYAINIHCMLPLATELNIQQECSRERLHLRCFCSPLKASYASLSSKQLTDSFLEVRESSRGLHNVRKPSHHVSECGRASAYTTLVFVDL